MRVELDRLERTVGALPGGQSEVANLTALIEEVLAPARLSFLHVARMLVAYQRIVLKSPEPHVLEDLNLGRLAALAELLEVDATAFTEEPIRNAGTAPPTYSNAGDAAAAPDQAPVELDVDF